ncbi:MAG: acyltransferase [Fusobacterium varium]|uniref:acyltransferase n=1 Tax=Fusobacterium varium TaxID=856 RepID=UPI00242A7899|nr:acyltransferase [Fusobacterium varium]UYI80043.1 MAG: acyltransferase [Fusobacterium varium]
MELENIFFDISKLKKCGKNVIIGKTVRIRKPELVSLGDNVIIDDFTYIPCELEVGSYTHIGCNNSFIGGSGKIKIGSFVNIAPGCQIVTGSNNYYKDGLVGPCIPKEYSGNADIKEVIIEDYVLIGCQTVILEGSIISEGVSIGAMSLVKEKNDLEKWSLYVGNPLKKIGKRQGRVMKKKGTLLLEEKHGIY